MIYLFLVLILLLLIRQTLRVRLYKKSYKEIVASMTTTRQHGQRMQSMRDHWYDAYVKLRDAE